LSRTVINTYTTITTTTTNTIRTTPITTNTVTALAKAKRGLSKNRFDAGAVARFIRVAEASGTATADSTFVAAISSACSCLHPTPATSTVTYTDATSVSFFQILFALIYLICARLPLDVLMPIRSKLSTLPAL